MHFALIIDDYMPNSTRIGAKMYHELAKEIIKQGYAVTVITPHFDKNMPKLVEDKYEGVRVWRFYSGKIKDINKVRRALNETQLSFRAWNSVKRKITHDLFDGIIFYSPTIFFEGLVSRIKKKCNCSAYLVLRDFFPQWAIDSEIIKENSFTEKYFRYFEKKTYQIADNIGIMSEHNLNIFKKKTDGAYQCSVLRNWANLSPHNKSSKALDIRKNLGLDEELIFFYGGNIGHAQDMSNLMRLVKSMQSKKAHFLFIGQGDEVQLIKRLASSWNLKNFSYLPSVNQSKFKDILEQVDVGLFSLSAKHTTHNFPGKLLGYMVQSIPIVGSVNKGNDLINLFHENNAALLSINGDDNSLLKNTMNLLNSPELRKGIGAAGFRLLQQEFSVEYACNKIISALNNSK